MKHHLRYALHDVASYINWLYFFHTWGFPARYGSIASVHGCEACRQNWLQSFPEEEREKARQAINLLHDTQAMLNEMDTRFQAHTIVALMEANGDGDDIVLYADEGGQRRLPMLRQQSGEECLCLSDFILPMQSGKRDRIGIFVATVDCGLEQSYADDNYRHMICQTLADRLAEATAERAHEEVRKSLWGYAPEERLTMEEMFREEYQGKRLAVGYPSMPDQSINFLIDGILDMGSVGVTLTESGAMLPHASTSGLMIRHPKARHFGVGHIGTDQLEDYAKRRGLPIDRMRQFLTSNI